VKELLRIPLAEPERREELMLSMDELALVVGVVIACAGAELSSPIQPHQSLDPLAVDAQPLRFQRPRYLATAVKRILQVKLIHAPH
jgi:hypothetical protein